MSGIYIHIPVCKTKCNYCDFYSSTEISSKEKLITCFKTELGLQKDYLKNNYVETIYFGGGTPSLVTISELSEILNKIYFFFNVSKNVELTIEVNPDDVSFEYLRDLKLLSFNRISIGVQSFFDDDLIFLGRRHNSEQSIQSIVSAHKAGFENISIDLIYGLPEVSLSKWKLNLEKAFYFPISHLSAYHLTYEEGTKLFNDLRSKKFSQTPENSSFEQFKFLHEFALSQKFIHYEVSNFSKEKYYSKHNVNYWKSIEYLGIGPSAHSFNISSRQWNIANSEEYIQSIESGKVPCITEKISLTSRYNEYIMTSLRTMWGIDLKFISENFGQFFYDYCLKESKKYFLTNGLIASNDFLKLTLESQFISNTIISDLFYIE